MVPTTESPRGKGCVTSMAQQLGKAQTRTPVNEAELILHKRGLGGHGN